MDQLNDFRQWRDNAALEQAVEDALQNLPLVEPPEGMAQAVLLQVENMKRITTPEFRLIWMDFALSLFFAGMTGLALLLSGWLPPELRMSLAWQMSWLKWTGINWALWSSIGLGGAACIVACVIFAQNLFSGRIN